MQPSVWVRSKWPSSVRRASLVALGALLATALQAPDAEAVEQCKPSSVVSGVDLNPDGDGTLPWASSGTGFAIIKATQGDYYTDADFAANWAALKSAKVVRGAYHFFDATVSGVDQANYFLSVVGTIEPGDLPPTLDIECPASGDSDCLGDGSSGAAPASQITMAMNDFLTTVKTATGLTPIVYSYGSWFSDNGVDTTGLQNYPLWIADYSGTNCFNVPTPWTAATFWQYDSSGDVGGVNVDDDYFLGSSAQLATFTASGSLPIDGGAGDSGTDYGTCTVTATGDMGVCIDTSECASEGGTPTPDYCPGPSNIQCCTGIKVKDGGAGDARPGGKHDGGGSASDAGGITPRAEAGAGNGDVPPSSDGGGSSGGCACSLPRGPAPSSGLLLSSMLALMFATRRARRVTLTSRSALRAGYRTSKRSRFMTLVQAATKSWMNFSRASELP
jgi:GH25 family lysozyme M1 (1,4-beta-N-acetylmuramidase)